MGKRMKKISAVLLAVALGACAEGGGIKRPSDRPFENWEKGAVLGAAAGAGLGAIAYSKNRSTGAIYGAVGGGLAGAAVGAYMDSQKRDLEKNLAREIQSGQAKVEKLPNDVVRITMTGQTAFETNSTDIKPGFYSTMDKLADVVVRYGKTTLTVMGHTDNVGSDSFNQDLSLRRAHSVAHYFESKKVDPVRMAIAGKGETAPVASNASETGRQQNRRVEIYVEPVRQG
jgi:outer membrane protein OmpA-like peptidoglycan-associated protein